MSAGIDRVSQAETRRLHQEMRSPLPADGGIGAGVDHVDQLSDLWADPAIEGAPVEPAVPAPPTIGSAPVVDLSSAAPAWPREKPPVLPSRPQDLIVLPADDPISRPREVGADEGPVVEGPRASRRERRSAARLAKEERRGTRLDLRRHRILPRTVIGISALLLAAAVGAAFSGALLYAYYDWRLSSNEDRVGVLAQSLQARLTDAGASIDEAQQQALAELQNRAGPLIDQKSDAVAMADLTPLVMPSVFFLSTQDENGQPSVGTAFVVSSDDAHTFLLTSYRAVAASTTTPAPQITVTNNGGEPLVARLHSWDPEHDLALLDLDRGGLEPLTWATGESGAVTGKPVYAASGIGAAGVTFSPGTVLDQSADGIQMTAPVGSAWQGAPVLNQDGQVVAVASVAYQPLGFNPGQVPFAPPVDAACDRVLECDTGTPEAGTTG